MTTSKKNKKPNNTVKDTTPKQTKIKETQPDVGIKSATKKPNKKNTKKNSDVIPESKIKKYLKFLNNFTSACGMADWKIILVGKYQHDLGDSLARTGFDPMEKEAEISLSAELKGCPDKKVFNILLHELIHTRLGYMNYMIEDATNIHEEMFVNDITRGFELFTEFK